MNKKIIFIIALLCLAVVVAIPYIDYIFPTLADDESTSNNSIQVNISINESNLAEVKFNWNGTNYTIYDKNLVLMLNLDNLSILGENNTLVVDSSMYHHNGTPVGADSNVSGRYHGAYHFNNTLFDAHQYITINDLGVFNFSQNFSYGAWFYPTTSSIAGIITNHGLSISWGKGYFLYKDSDYAFCVLGNSSHNSYAKSGRVMSENIWHYAMCVYDGTEIILYLDGIKYRQKQGPNITNIPYNNSLPLTIGKYTQDGEISGFGGSIDEVRVWNISLDENTITQMYYSNLNKYDTDKWYFYTNQTGLTNGNYSYYGCATNSAGNENCTTNRSANIMGDLTSAPPTVTLQNPDNNSWNTSRTINFTYTPSDDSGFDNCSLWTNESGWNYTQINLTAIVNGSVNGIQYIFTLDGHYLWNVKCFDNATIVQSNFSSNNYTVKIDTTYPLIFNETRVTDPVTTGANSTFTVNITENNWDTVIFSFTKWSQDFSSYVWTNFTVTNYTGNSTHRKYNYPLDYNLIYSTQGASGQNYTWFFWVNDSVGHTNQTDNNTFEVFPVCGNGICEGGESSSTCPADCGAPSGPGGTGGGGGAGGGGIANVTKLEPGQYTPDPLICSTETAIGNICANESLSYIISPGNIYIKTIPDYVLTTYLYITNKESSLLKVNFDIPNQYKEYFKWTKNYSIMPNKRVKFDLSFKTPPVVNTKYEFDMIINLSIGNLKTYKIIPVIIEASEGKVIGEACTEDIECLYGVCEDNVCKSEKQSLLIPVIIILVVVLLIIAYFIVKKRGR